MKRLVLIFLFIFLIYPQFSFAALASSVPIKILLVPGHDNESWGAQYGTLKEADMNLKLAEEIYNLLKKDKKFEVYITRDWDGYKKEFADFFKEKKDEIVSFRRSAKKNLQEKISNGDFLKKYNVPHNSASESTSIILYGINKWANDKKIDAVVHIHFNDHFRESKWVRGMYKGFVIYIPDEQFVNSYQSTKLGLDIFLELKEKYITSNYSPEKSGVVADQSLIALGAYGTLVSSVKSVLIEYGYIYRFGDRAFRSKAYKDMANSTVVGINNYFSNK